jgi:hypothetical protein
LYYRKSCDLLKMLIRRNSSIILGSSRICFLEKKCHDRSLQGNLLAAFYQVIGAGQTGNLEFNVPIKGNKKAQHHILIPKSGEKND